MGITSIEQLQQMNQQLKNDIVFSVSELIKEAEVNNKSLESRVSNMENIVENHMKWEEKNYDDIKEILKNQQRSIEQIADKLAVSKDNLTSCKIELKKEIQADFISKKDLEIALAKRDDYHKEHYLENKNEINKAKYILYGIGLVMLTIQFLLNNVTKVDKILHEPVSIQEKK